MRRDRRHPGLSRALRHCSAGLASSRRSLLSAAHGIALKALVDWADSDTPENPIDERIKTLLAGTDLTKLHVYRQVFPEFRFVDLYQAASRFSERFPDVEIVESQHSEELSEILNGTFYSEPNQTICLSRPMHCGTFPSTGRNFCPASGFGCGARRAEDSSGRAFILRVSHQEAHQVFGVEVASDDRPWAEETLRAIAQDGIANTIFRNHLLQVSFGPRIRPESGDSEHDGMHVDFGKEVSVTRDDIIMDSEVEALVRRNLIEFVRHRALLLQNGVPLRRGVLFYGPPGTGKTYTCKYVQHELGEITTIVVAGDDLANIKPICDLARLLQPCLLVLEDVDLAFASRNNNPFNSVLGDLLDEMDGFQNNDSIVFLLTTNAIERLEPAIKERPGRISQCIYFDLPQAPLRKAYLERFLRPYDQKELRIGAIVTMTEGTSQAFLKGNRVARPSKLVWKICVKRSLVCC